MKKSRKPMTMVALMAATVTALIASVAGPAVAAEPSGSASDVTHHVAGVGGAAASDAAEALVSLSGSRVDVSVRGGSVGLTLPGEPISAIAARSHPADGNLRSEASAPIVTTEDGGALFRTFGTEDGAQTLIEIPSFGAPSEYRFPLSLPEGATAEVASDGSVMIMGAEGPLGQYRTPWVVDAAGASVPTSLRIEGSTLVQTVNFTADNMFPVVADPDFGGEWWGWYLQLTSAETRQLADQSGDIQGWIATASGFCGFIPAAPVAAACALVVNIQAMIWKTQVVSAADSGRCIAINLPWAAITHPQVVGANMTTVDCRR